MLQLDRQLVEIARSLAPIAPSAWPPREVKSSAQTMHGAALDPAPAADVVGRREVGDVAVLVVAWRSRPGCRPRGSCRRRAAASMRSRQVSLPRLRWRTTPGSFEPGASRVWAIACSAATFVEQRRPGVVRRHRRARPAAAPAAGVMTARIWPPSTVSPTASGATAVDHAGAGCGDRGLHLHRADDDQRVARVHRGARARP